MAANKGKKDQTKKSNDNNAEQEHETTNQTDNHISAPENTETLNETQDNTQENSNENLVKTGNSDEKQAIVKASDLLSTNTLIAPDKQGEENLTFDLGNLMVTNPDPVDVSKFKQNPGEYNKELCTTAVQNLINEVFQLPTVVDNDNSSKSMSILALLPEPQTVLPREKPLPEKKEPTAWEKFAAMKGIVKHKRSGKVWDNVTKTWVPRFGRGSIKKIEEDTNWIRVAPADGSDPFETERKEKKKQIEDQLKRQKKNEYKANKSAISGMGTFGEGGLQTYRAVKRGRDETEKNTEKEEKKIAGISTKSSMSERYAKRKKELKGTLDLLRGSTASMGKFDRQLSGYTPKPKSLRSSKDAGAVFDKTGADHDKDMRIAERIAKKQDKIDTAKATTTEMQAVKKKGKEAVKQLSEKKQRLDPKQRARLAMAKGKRGKKAQSKKK